MKKVVFLTVFSIVLLLTACAENPNSSTNQEIALATVPAEYAGITNPLGSESANDGAAVYNSYCLSCHGETGKGDGYASTSLEPKPKDLSQLGAVAGDDYLFWRISKGKEGTAMIGWGGVLEDEQIWQVVSFIRTLK